MAALGRILELASAAGGGLALVFIVLVAAGIGALGLVYLASASLALERFARVPRRWPVVVGFASVGAVLGAFLLRAALDPGGSDPGFAAWLRAFVGVAVFTALAIALADRVIARVGAPRRNAAVAALFALTLLLWVAGVASGRPDFAAAGAGGIGLVFAAIVLGLGPLAAAGLFELRKSAEWFIAVRYLVAKRRQVFISAISAICVGGIAAGVWLIVVVLSVMNGFEQTWREEILGRRPHFRITAPEGALQDWQPALERVQAAPGVTAAAPYLDADAMVRGPGGGIASVRVRGVDPVLVDAVSGLEDDMILGSLDRLRDTGEGGRPGIVIGNQLAMSAGVSLDDDLLLISPFGGPPTPLGPAPRLARFRIVGIFQTSFFQYDQVTTYVSLPAAQDFRRAGEGIDGIEARTADFYRSGAIARGVAEGLEEALPGSFVATDWKEFFPAFFQALKTERVMMFILLAMIMVVAAFLIVATLVMMIMEKSSDIAILKAMGAEDETVERIFAIEGTLIGLLGTGLGVVAGVAVTHQLGWIQDRIEWLTGVDALAGGVYQFASLPSKMDALQVALVVAIAMVLSLGATLLPSRQGARLDPAEGLRYE